MGVDYDGIGGIGIELDSEMVAGLILAGHFTSEEWDEDDCQCVEGLGILYSQAGSSYSGEEWYYLMVDGDTLSEINANAIDFCSDLASLGIKVDVGSLRVISDIHIW